MSPLEEMIYRGLIEIEEEELIPITNNVISQFVLTSIANVTSKFQKSSEKDTRTSYSNTKRPSALTNKIWD
jgi:hypothetical protein